MNLHFRPSDHSEYINPYKIRLHIDGPPIVCNVSSPFISAHCIHVYDADLKGDTACGTTWVRGGPWGHIQTIYGKMMNVKYVWNFDADMDIQKFLRYRRNFCHPKYHHISDFDYEGYIEKNGECKTRSEFRCGYIGAEISAISLKFLSSQI